MALTPHVRRRRWLLPLAAAPLVAAPLLLLVPLRALRWRADHPPVSPMDERLRAALNPANSVLLMGTGYSKTWRELTGLDATRGIHITDRAVFRALMATLRCRAVVESGRTPPKSDVIYLSVTGYDARTHRVALDDFTYWRDSQGSYVARSYAVGGGETVGVQPRFVPRFEALLRSLAQRARAKGHHPQITLQPLSVPAPLPAPPAP